MPSRSIAASVVVPGVPQELSYSADLEKFPLTIGDEVLVPLANRRVRAWVIDLEPLEQAQNRLEQSKRQKETPDDAGQMQLFDLGTLPAEIKLKAVLGHSPAFLTEQIPLFRWMAEYYGAPLAEILDTAIPQRVLGSTITTVSLNKDLDLEQTPSRAKLQQQIIAFLRNHPDPTAINALEERWPNARQAINALQKKGIVILGKAHKERTAPYPSGLSPDSLFSGEMPELLTAEQEQVLQVIQTSLRSQSFSPNLLHGVTGSGKTEVYLRAIEAVLHQGGSALLMVPEIGLTPQLLDYGLARLKVPIALLHSNLSAGERWDYWQRLYSGEIRLAIGARSAVFAPLRNLQLIIVDEEHESSYKQSDNFRYHGRDVAVMRAKLTDSTIILGSATPSLESVLNAHRKRYQLLEINERANARPLPEMEIVDLNKIKRKEMPSENISPQLFSNIALALESREQVVILYNRRGFSSYLQCDSCGEALLCPQCSVTLTYHKKRERVICHYCGQSQAPPTHCPTCRNPQTSRLELPSGEPSKQLQREAENRGKLVQRGAGTEKVVDELASLFPQAKILRMDRDTVGTKGAHRTILGKMRSGEGHILVGTQMIAKGHDLPGVTLVGIIDADVGLHFPDFRSSERTFQLITQAAGRAGRGRLPGRVIIQTSQPNHPTILATQGHRFSAFARFQLQQRKNLNYPPYGRMLRAVVSSPNRQDAALIVDDLAQLLQNTAGQGESSVTILGPAPATLERIRCRYRFHLLLKSSSAKRLSEIAAFLYRWEQRELRRHKEARLVIDLDPVDML